MIRRKRVNVKRSSERAFLVSLLLMALYSVAVGLAFVGLQSACQTLARELKREEDRLTEVARRRQHEEYRWGMLNTVDSVAFALRGFGISMSWPERSRVVILSRAEHLAAPLSAPQTTQLAQYRRAGRSD